MRGQIVSCYGTKKNRSKQNKTIGVIMKQQEGGGQMPAGSFNSSKPLVDDGAKWY
jgi:hypothetical protein